MQFKLATTLVAGLASLALAPRFASAQTTYGRTYERTTEGWQLTTTMSRQAYPSHVMSPMGAQLLIGGGVGDFTGETIQRVTDTGGAWLVRLVVGTRTLFGAEASYVGEAREIDALGLARDSVLVRNGFEGAIRLNLPFTQDQYLIGPYIFGGLGWNRFDIVNSARNTSSIRDGDDIFVVPFGAGLNVSVGQFALDTRITFRPAFDDELIGSRGPAESRTESLDSWAFTAALGAEF
ncbi:MAG: hypothetical protein HYY06_30165 [Deltaproteobacteria bacterium]|nr:hypothetical protein [Deltaproteobacteria bacterium]